MFTGVFCATCEAPIVNVVTDRCETCTPAMRARYITTAIEWARYAKENNTREASRKRAEYIRKNRPF